MKKLHDKTNTLNDQLELIVSKIVENRSTKNLIKESEALNTMIVEYNDLLDSLGSDKTLEPYRKGVQQLDRLGLEVAINTLARIQQEIAVNENGVLVEMVLN